MADNLQDIINRWKHSPDEMVRHCATVLESAQLKDLLCPHESVKGLWPMVIYFDTEKEGMEFERMVHEAKPNMKVRHL